MILVHNTSKIERFTFGRNFTEDFCAVSEGIKLTAYQRLGSIHLSRPVIERRSGSDPSEVANTADLDVEPVNKLTVPKDSTLR